MLRSLAARVVRLLTSTSPTRRLRTRCARRPSAYIRITQAKFPLIAHRRDHECIMITWCFLTKGAAERRPTPRSRADAR